MRKNIRFIALMLLCSIFSTTVSAVDLGSEKINTENGNSISAQDNVVYDIKMQWTLYTSSCQ